MSEVSDRDEKEEELARKLARQLRGQLNALMDLMGDPPSIDNVPDSFWEQNAIDMGAVLRPFLEKLYLEQAGRMLEDEAIGVDWALVNQGAINWATDYTFDLIRGIDKTSLATVRDALTAYYDTPGMTIGELEDRLMGTFGPIRAEMIAVTEVTRASTQGERAIADELEKQGIKMIPIFNTNVDELVCEICAPLDGKEIKNDDDYPPKHPRCRCWVNHELRP